MKLIIIKRGVRMKIKLWGTRGSTPVSGPQYVKYGGNTPCVEVRFNDGNILIIDAGTGIRELGESLIEEGFSKELNITITHSHWDHIQGFPFFKPIYLKEARIKIRGYISTAKKLKQILATQMEKTYFPVPLDALASEIIFDESVDNWNIEEALIKGIEVNHPSLCYAVKIIEDNKSFVFMTDNELGQKESKTDYKDFVEFVRDVDYLIHDTMYLDEEMSEKRGWGHSSLGEVTKLAIDANVKNLGLYHHDPTRTDDQIDEMETRCRQILKDNGSNTLCFATYDRQELIF